MLRYQRVSAIFSFGVGSQDTMPASRYTTMDRCATGARVSRLGQGSGRKIAASVWLGESVATSLESVAVIPPRCSSRLDRDSTFRNPPMASGQAPSAFGGWGRRKGMVGRPRCLLRIVSVAARSGMRCHLPTHSLDIHGSVEHSDCLSERVQRPES